MNIPGRVATHEKQTPYRVFKGRNSPEFLHRYFSYPPISYQNLTLTP